MYKIYINNNKGLVIPSESTLSFVKALSIVCLNSKMNCRVFDMKTNELTFIHRGAK
jgi:hypothetical protein